MNRPWDAFISSRDREVYDTAGWGQPAGYGAHPALLVIDVTHDFLGDRPEPILDSIKRFTYSCGEGGWLALERIVELLAAARRAGLPVFYTKTADRAVDATTSWAWKNARHGRMTAEEREIGTKIPEAVAPQPGDVVIEKEKPSAFFGTPLASYLTPLGIDTLVVAGTTTSGCVRATVVDGFSLNYRVVVAEDAVFDRGDLAHAANLFDMQAKYADVRTAADIVEYFSSLRTTG